MTFSQKFTAIALTILMNLICWLPLNFNVGTAPEKNETDLRIISYNVRCANDLYGSVLVRSKLVTSLIKEYEPDSFGVQEATKSWMRALKNRLKDYDYVGEYRDNYPIGTEASAVFYLKDKYNLVDSGTIWLSDTPDVKYTKYEDSGCYRVASWATLENKETGEIYTHINTHLDHKGEQARLNQIQVLKNKIEELQAQGYPVVCTGDFNNYESSSEYETMVSLMDDSKYLAKESDSGITYHNYKRVEDKDEPIDFIFVPEDTAVSRYRIMDEMYKDKVFLSDHYGICVDLKFSK